MANLNGSQLELLEVVTPLLEVLPSLFPGLNCVREVILGSELDGLMAKSRRPSLPAPYTLVITEDFSSLEAELDLAGGWLLVKLFDPDGVVEEEVLITLSFFPRVSPFFSTVPS